MKSPTHPLRVYKVTAHVGHYPAILPYLHGVSTGDFVPTLGLALRLGYGLSATTTGKC